MWYWCFCSFKIQLKHRRSNKYMYEVDTDTLKPEYSPFLKLFNEDGNVEESRFISAKRIDIFNTVFASPDVAKLTEEVFRYRKKQ